MDTQGRVVGISTAMPAGAQNIGLAIPLVGGLLIEDVEDGSPEGEAGLKSELFV